MNFIILAYHRVLPQSLAVDRGKIAVTTENFDRQLKYFANKGWRSIALSQLYRDHMNTGTLPRKTVIVTFDDGYKDNYVHAFPILRKYNMSATVFLTAGYLNGEKALWFDEAKRTYEPNDVDYCLSKNDMREMSNFGIEFGSHTISHLRLAEIDADRAEYEIAQSKEILEEHLGTEVTSFCYPYGSVNDQVVELVRRSGYKIGVVTPPRPGIQSSILTMRRTGVYLTDSLVKVRLKCSRLFYAARERKVWQDAQRLTSSA